jgi:D-aminopeptidase
MTAPLTRLDKALAALPGRYAGPGGAVAVLRDGETLIRHAWGWADVECRRPFTPETMALVCSITKQFTCALLLDQFPDPTALDGDLADFMPALQQPSPGILDLCHNQSGLRDYWATAMLCGAPVEGYFGPEDARRLIARTRTLHFQPGTRYSYVNQNFRLLGDIIERHTGQNFATLLRSRILDRAGMPHARLNPDTSQVAGGTIGYEGSVEHGFRPAVNRIVWTGDAGLAASLDDMIAWERFIDATRDDPDALYSRLAAPTNFRDGTAAAYGFGLARATLFGRPATCHSGGLRGWRSVRFHLPSERISVVALFNHMADPRAAALDLLAALLDEPAPQPPTTAPTGWDGRYLEPETGLAVRIETQPDHRLRLHYAPGPDLLSETASGHANGGAIQLHRDADGIRMTRMLDHQSTRLIPCAGEPAPDIEGVFHSDELDADLTCVSAGGALYGAFSGDLGQGAMQPLLPFTPDIWLLPCPRALDHAAPGDWTLRFERDSAGLVTGVRVGCWLARDIAYTRT